MRRLLGWIAGLGLTAAASAQQMQIQFAEPVNINVTAGAAQFDAYGRRFNLLLQSNDRLLKALPSKQRAAAVGAQLLRGKLEGAPGSWVRLARVGGALQGALWDGRDLYVITSHQRIAKSLTLPLDVAPTQTVMFRLSDAISGLPAQFCGTEATLPRSRGNAPNLLKQFRDVVTELRANALAAPAEQLEIALIADTAFQAQFGAAATDTMLARLNTVDGIFAEQVGVLIVPTELRLVPNGADPFTATESSDLLQQVADYRSGDVEIRTPGLAHLMTGKNLNGDVIGIAYVDALCEQREGVSLSESSWGDFQSALIMAHELGHNFGALHDGVPGICESTQQFYLMAPALNNSSQFSQCSLDSMASSIERARGVCVVPASYADVAVELPASPYNADTRTSFSLPVTVRSVGTLTATGVQLVVDLPMQFTFQSAVLSGGSCSASGNSVTCVLEDLDAGSQRLVELQLLGNQDGIFNLQARVSAANDLRASNNSRSVQVGLQVGSDLALALAADPLTLYANDPIDITLDVTSTRSQAVTGGRVDLHMGTIAIESVVSGAHTCVISSQPVTSMYCLLADIPGGASTQITVRGRPASAGFTRLSGMVTSTNDSNSLNNHAFADIQVLAERQVITRASTESLRAVIGAPYDVTYTLTAAGRLPATDVTFLVDPPSLGAVESVTPSAGSCSAPLPQTTTSCDFGTMSPGDTRTVVVRLRMNSAGDSLLAGRTRYTNGAVQDSTYAHTWIVSNMSVDVSANFNSPHMVTSEGQTLSSGFIVQSLGVDPPQNVVATMELPAPARFTSFTAQTAPAGWSCVTLTPQQARCTGSFQQPSPGSPSWASVRFDVVSDSPMDAQATLTVTADGDGDSTNNTKAMRLEVLTYLDVGITSGVSNRTLLVGEIGTVEAALRTAQNPVPGVLVWADGNGPEIEFESITVNGATCTPVLAGPFLRPGCDLGVVPANANLTVTARYRALQADRGGQVQFMVSTPRDSNFGNNIAYVGYQTAQMTDLQLSVAGTTVSANNGTQLHFPLVTVTNGAATARNVTVDIPLPNFATLEMVSSSGVCSGTSTLSCSWSNLAPGASVTVDFYLRGRGVGTFTSNLLLRADNDSAAGNNGGAVSVAFVAPPTSGGGSSSGGGKKKKGGGALEWLSLIALGAMLYRRRRTVQ